MSLTPYNTSLLQVLKWMQNQAPNITSLITQKDNWYTNYQWTFWQNWYTNVFNLATANNFGILIWCIILGVPTQVFGLDATTYAWAYGNSRQNYINSQTPAPPDANLIGGNFAAGGQTTILNLQEARWALQLRYVTLVSNGRLSFINKMLNWIFNNGLPWNFAAGQYFYVADCTLAGVPISNAVLYANGIAISPANYTINTTTGAVAFTAGNAPASGATLTWSGSWNSGTIPTSSPQAFGTGNGSNLNFVLTSPPYAAVPNPTPMTVEFHIGPNMDFSSQFVNLLNSPQYGILPQFAGMGVTVLVDGSGGTFMDDGGVMTMATAEGYPTSPSGLSAGQVWWNGGTIGIIPGVTPSPTAPPLYFATTTPAQLLAFGAGNLPHTPGTTGSTQLWNNGGSIAIS